MSHTLRPTTPSTDRSPTTLASTIGYFTLERIDAGQEGTTSTL